MTEHHQGWRASRPWARFAGAALFALMLLAPLDAALAGDEDVVATVDGKAIVEGDVRMLQGLMGDALARVPEASRHDVLVNVLIETRLLAAAAEAAGTAATADFGRRLEWLRLQALRDSYVSEEVDAQVTDEVVRARYDEVVKSLPPQIEIRARHILVKSEEEAVAVIAELDKGGDFAELAKAKSLDRGGADGGDLGFLGRGRTVPEFEAAAFALKAGEYSKVPVKTQYGFHVIKVEEERQTPPPAFEEVKDRLRERMQADKLRETIEALRTKAAIELKKPAAQ
jgi:peptidyl-prolyl cis-trans isomerase C